MPATLATRARRLNGDPVWTACICWLYLGRVYEAGQVCQLQKSSGKCLDCTPVGFRNVVAEYLVRACTLALGWEVRMTIPAREIGGALQLPTLTNFIQGMRGCHECCACLPQLQTGGVLQPSALSSLLKAVGWCGDCLSPPVLGIQQEGAACEPTHLCQRVSGECKIGFCPHLYFQGEFHLSLALPADGFRLPNEFYNRPLAFFKLLFFCWVLGMMRLHVSPLKGASQFPIALWVPQISAPLHFLSQMFWGSSLWFRGCCK